MEGTPEVKRAVEDGRAVIACAYQSHVPDEVKKALPDNYRHRRYVAKFEDGKLVALRDGLPEEVILAMLSPAHEAEPEARPAPVQTSR